MHARSAPLAIALVYATALALLAHGCIQAAHANAPLPSPIQYKAGAR